MYVSTLFQMYFHKNRPKRVTSCHAVRVERYKMNVERLRLFDEKYLSSYSDLLTFWTQLETLLSYPETRQDTHCEIRVVFSLESLHLFSFQSCWCLGWKRDVICDCSFVHMLSSQKMRCTPCDFSKPEELIASCDS